MDNDEIKHISAPTGRTLIEAVRDAVQGRPGGTRWKCDPNNENKLLILDNNGNTVAEITNDLW